MDHSAELPIYHDTVVVLSQPIYSTQKDEQTIHPVTTLTCLPLNNSLNFIVELENTNRRSVMIHSHLSLPPRVVTSHSTVNILGRSANAHSCTTQHSLDLILKQQPRRQQRCQHLPSPGRGAAVGKEEPCLHSSSFSRGQRLEPPTEQIPLSSFQPSETACG
jgi:hypothetical protein